MQLILVVVIWEYSDTFIPNEYKQDQNAVNSADVLTPILQHAKDKSIILKKQKQQQNNNALRFPMSLHNGLVFSYKLSFEQEAQLSPRDHASMRSVEML